MELIAEYDIPEWALYALEYGVDEDGSLDEDDRRLILDFQKRFPKGYFMVIDWCDYSEFNTRPEFGLACKTYKVKFYN